MSIDPVCGMQVDEKTAVHTSLHAGRTYYFCAPGCKRTFEQNPEKFLDPKNPPAHHGHHA